MILMSRVDTVICFFMSDFVSFSSLLAGGY